jgi:acetyl esterase/lipase
MMAGQPLALSVVSLRKSFFNRGPRTPGARSFATDIAEVRRQFSSISEKFGNMPQEAGFRFGHAGPVQGEWVKVPDASPDRLILYFHGGGYVAGSPDTHRPLIARLCQAAQSNAFVPAYRLAPEFAFPAGLHDAIDAYRYLLQMNIAPSSIVLAGDDAGGGLAFACMVAIRDAGLPTPAGIAAMSPWADLSLSGWSLLQNANTETALSWDMLFVGARHYLKKQNPSDPYVSPVFASFRDFPPVMVHAGSNEILRDDASRLGDRAAEAGVPVSVEIYDGMQHLFQASTQVPAAHVSIQRLGQFIKARTASAAGEPAAEQV